MSKHINLHLNLSLYYHAYQILHVNFIPKRKLINTSRASPIPSPCGGTQSLWDPFFNTAWKSLTRNTLTSPIISLKSFFENMKKKTLVRLLPMNWNIVLIQHSSVLTKNTDKIIVDMTLFKRRTSFLLFYKYFHSNFSIIITFYDIYS